VISDRRYLNFIFLTLLSYFLILHMNVLCVIPARMGSVRLPNKNLLEIEPGVSLIEQALWCANGRDTVISTDRPDLMPPAFSKYIVKRPSEISKSTSDILEATIHGLEQGEIMYGKKYNTIVTLMPAIAARSPQILDQMLDLYENNHCQGAISVAPTHPWIWQLGPNGDSAVNSWYPNTQPRSQDMPAAFTEVLSIYISPKNQLTVGQKWGLPLLVYELPEWSSVFDIDTQQDLDESVSMYPWAKPQLERWTGKSHVLYSVNGLEAPIS
jgi:CMP-N-acetylneuraminic acid synthetase